MSVRIALFRGLNVGGSHKTPMAELRAMLADLGCRDVATYIQSGNAVFAAEGAEDTLADRIETRFAASFGFRSDAVLRSAARWRAAIEACPFRAEAANHRAVHIGYLRGRPDADRLTEVLATESGQDRAVWAGNEIYLHAPDGLARSKLVSALVSRKFGTTITLRNWRTVETLAEMAGRIA